MDLARAWIDRDRERAEGSFEERPSLPVAFIADEQVSGRGRQGRRWVQASGSSSQPPLMATFLFPCDREISSLSGYSLAVGVAISLAWDAYCGESGKKLSLKWPNDVVAQHPRLLERFGKVGGVLVEVLPCGTNNHALSIGIGINTNAIPEDVPEALALSELLGAGSSASEVERDRFFSFLAAELLEMHVGFMKEGFRRFRATWIARSAFVAYRTNLTIDLGDEQLRAVFTGISESGALVVGQESAEGGAVHRTLCEREIHSGHILNWDKFGEMGKT